MTHEVDARLEQIDELRALGERLVTMIGTLSSPVEAAVKQYARLHPDVSRRHHPCTRCLVNLGSVVEDVSSLYSEWICDEHCSADGKGIYVPMLWLRQYLAGCLDS